MNTRSKGCAYDRQLLLEGEKRNAVLDLTEVQRYGIESWGNPDYVCIYGLRLALGCAAVHLRDSNSNPR
jgi:hypothetical protein